MNKTFNQVAIDHAKELEIRRDQVDNLAMLVRRLCRSIKAHVPEGTLAPNLVYQAMDYLKRNGLLGSPLRGDGK